MTMSPIRKTFLVLRPFEGALTCSILIAEPKLWSEKRIFLGEGPGEGGQTDRRTDEQTNRQMT
jgi:hypothetical protein